MTTSDDGGEGGNIGDEAPPHPATQANGKAAKPAKPRKEKKPSRMGTIMAVVHLLRAGALMRNFRVMRSSRGKAIPLEVNRDDVVTIIERDDFEDAVLKYAHVGLGSYDPELTAREANEVWRQWRALEKPIPEEEIIPVAELSQKGLCWHRLPFDIESGPHATFTEMMGRTINARALMAWIGGLFTPGSDRSQYAYIYGEGANGKGRLADALRRCLGQAYRAEEAPEPGNRRFWTSGLVGARLIVLADLDKPGFVNTAFFKSLTGDDAVRVEWKGGAATTVTLQGKFLCLSNSEPALNHSDANSRRAIYAMMHPLPATTNILPAGIYGEMLWMEMPAFLASCKEEWRKHAKTGRIVMETQSLLSDAIANHEASFIDIVDRWFEVGVDLEMPAGAMQAILRRERMRDNRDQPKWFEFLARRYAATRRQMGSGNGRYRAICGLTIKEGMKPILEKFIVAEQAEAKSNF